MHCSEIEPWLAAAADGSIDDDRARMLNRHLAECAGCRATLADQTRVWEMLAATPMAPARSDFTARVNAQIDAPSGWLGMADFRAWTLRLAPVAAAIALIAALWPAPPRAASSSAPPARATFSPASISDWERNVSPNALLEAALRPVPGETDVR